jgi:hypothetical protein
MAIPSDASRTSANDGKVGAAQSAVSRIPSIGPSGPCWSEGQTDVPSKLDDMSGCALRHIHTDEVAALRPGPLCHVSSGQARLQGGKGGNDSIELRYEQCAMRIHMAMQPRLVFEETHVSELVQLIRAYRPLSSEYTSPVGFEYFGTHHIPFTAGSATSASTVSMSGPCPVIGTGTMRIPYSSQIAKSRS